MVSSKNPGKSFRVNLHFHVAISFPPFLAFCGRYFGGNKPGSPIGKDLFLWPFLESKKNNSIAKNIAWDSEVPHERLALFWLPFSGNQPLVEGQSMCLFKVEAEREAGTLSDR
jgi:hypothetical protein